MVIHVSYQVHYHFMDQMALSGLSLRCVPQTSEQLQVVKLFLEHLAYNNIIIQLHQAGVIC